MKRFVLASLVCLFATTVRADLIVVSDTLSPGSVNSHLFAASNGQLITVSTWSLSYPDTVLGLFRPDASLAVTDDDDNIAFLSARRFTADATGTWTAQVTGYPDFDFIGDHAESGPYSLVISTSDTGAEVEVVGGSHVNDSTATATPLAVLPNGGSRMAGTFFVGDVDFYSFSASAGSLLTAEVYGDSDLPYQFDSLLGLFDNFGTPLLVNDDVSPDLHSAFQLAAPYTGLYYVAVTQYPDFEFIGSENIDTGNYQLIVSGAIATVPEPGSMALAMTGLAVLGLAGIRRPRGGSSADCDQSGNHAKSEVK